MLLAWFKAIYLLIIFVLFFPMNNYSQHLETTRAFAYDRGLLSASEPFAPTGNPALLSLKNDIRLNLEYYRTKLDDYSLSLLYPLSSSTGLGIFYSSRYDDKIFDVPFGAFEVIQKKQTFLICLGHNYIFRFGQQIEFNFDVNRYSVIYQNENKNVPFTNDQLFVCSYRLGLFRQFFRKFTLGFLTLPLLQFQYHNYIDGEKSPNSIWHCWHELSQQTEMPLLAIEWRALPNLGFVVSNRSKSGSKNFQFASELTIKNLTITHALTQHDDSKKLNYILGVGGYYKGFELFAAVDVKNEGFRLAASISPERRSELIEVKNIELCANPIFSYRMRQHPSGIFAWAIIENKIENPVELTISLKNPNLPSLLKSAVLERASTSMIDLPIPTGLSEAKGGCYLYSVEILAYYRGKQIINRTLPIEIKDKHDWNGDARDLVYFVSPEENQIIKKAKDIISKYSANRDKLDAISLAEIFYRFRQDSLTYIGDPLQKSHERIQYPLELLKSKSGDCEDLSILMVSLLRCVGIDASFIEVLDPSAKQGHIFILFDSQQDVYHIVANNKNVQNYIIRQSDDGRAKGFVPIELTRSELSFKEAWRLAIETYYTAAIERNGLTNGLVKFIDLQE